MTSYLQPGSLKSAVDLYSKLQRDAQLLDDQITSDRLFNFVVTGYSLIDWIKNDPAVPAAAKTHAELQRLHSNRWLKVCGDIATAAKHFELTQRRPLASDVVSTQGYGVGRFGKGAYGVGEEAIEIRLLDGSILQASDLVTEVLKVWSDFFARHAL